MIIRLIFLTLFTSMSILLTMVKTGVGQTLLTFLSVFGLISILETIRTFKRLELNKNVLTIRQSFSRTKSFNLDHVLRWSEHNYYIRGQLKKSLVLFLHDDQKIEISIYDDINEFEKLEQYLKRNLAEGSTR